MLLQVHGVPQQKDLVLMGREQPREALASSKAKQMVGIDTYENGLRNNKLCHSKTSDNYKLPWR